MQATIDSFALKPFVRALTCLSRYGDELLIHATIQTLSFSVTSSSMSAYSRFMWDRQFFVRYQIGSSNKGKEKEAKTEEDGSVVLETVKGQLMVKSLLSILKHKTVEKTVEKCEFIIAHGSTLSDHDGDEEQDGLESTLTVRLHCQHGVIKTHRLLLSEPESPVAPMVPAEEDISTVTLPGRTIKDMLDHFPIRGGTGKDSRSDPQLVWTFEGEDVLIRSYEMGIDTRGKAQLNTELKIGVEEFEGYQLVAAPITIAFHLREFNATIAFADALSLSIVMNFTTTSAPLFIDIDGGDGYTVLFVISTTSAGTTFARQHTPKALNGRAAPPAPGSSNVRKRARSNSDSRSDSPGSNAPGPSANGTARSTSASHGAVRTPQRSAPQWAVQRTDEESHSLAMDNMSRRSPAPPSWSNPSSRAATPAQLTAMGPPPVPTFPRSDVGNVSNAGTELGPTQLPSQGLVLQPLFFPSSQEQDLGPPLSQLQLDGEAELAGMTEEDLDALIADDDDLDFAPDGSFAVLSSQKDSERELRPMAATGLPGSVFPTTNPTEDHDFEELMDDEMNPTQSQDRDDSRSFQPLFED